MKQHWLQQGLRIATATLAAAVLAACGGDGGGGNTNTTTPPGKQPQKPSVTPAPLQVRLLEVSSHKPGELTASWQPAATSGNVSYQLHVDSTADFTPTKATLRFEDSNRTSAVFSSNLPAGQQIFVKLVASAAGRTSVTSAPFAVMVANTPAKLQAGVQVMPLQASQTSQIAANSVTLRAGVSAPAVGGFIASATANDGYGFLRRVTGVQKTAQGTVLATRDASINEVVSDMSISSTFQMGLAPKETPVQSGLMRLSAPLGPDGKPDMRYAQYQWPETGYRYMAAVSQDNASAALQAGLSRAAAPGFQSNHHTRNEDDEFSVEGHSVIAMHEKQSGSLSLALTVTDRGKKKYEVCKLERTDIKLNSSYGDVNKLRVTVGERKTVQSEQATGRRKSDQYSVKFHAEEGSRIPENENYTVNMRAYFDEHGDNCNGDAILGTWSKTIDSMRTIFSGLRKQTCVEHMLTF